MRRALFRRRPEFTAHNIRLDDGSRTRPEATPIEEEPATVSYLRTLRLFCPPPARVADLGCLEGGYAVEFARAGYDVLGVEGQKDNFRTCEWVAERVTLPNLRFVHDDVRNLGAHGEFDAVLCAGLLYHLDEPVAMLNLLGELTRRLLIVNTQHSTEEGRELASGAPLSAELVEHEGKLGRWYEEPGGPWSSVGNKRSFWLERRNLLQAMIEAGFPTVFEQLDWLGNVVENRTIEERVLSCFVGAKAPAQGAQSASS